MRDITLKPEYSTSHALVIGINDHLHTSPLSYAVNDAIEVATTLEKTFGFAGKNITLLKDAEATKTSILSAYLAFTNCVDRDGRVVVFFAGHGHTISARNRDVGFLIPHDGNVADLATLIRWEELTLNAELIPAKHLFFIMDACYGGLFFNRAGSAGSVRFLKDMMVRSARQALTAGKQDEPVADGCGPRANHSIFTGHLLNALEGAARALEGHLTASGIMSYVYKQVSNDINSEQTPHFGFLSGDGDFVFDAPQLKGLPSSETKVEDTLVTISAFANPDQDVSSTDPFALAKQYLADPKFSICLHDLVMQQVRKTIVDTANEKFPVTNVQFSVEELTARLNQCERATTDLRGLLECLAYWGTDIHRPVLGKALSRVTDHVQSESGLTVWNTVRWYPLVLLCYASGVAAVASGNYRNLYTVFTARVAIPNKGSESGELVLSVSEAIVEMERTAIFKRLPGHEKFYTPRSEYLLKLFQPELDDDLFLGKEYEVVFDRFEVLLALACAIRFKQKGRGTWGPVGRFAWKLRGSITGSNPLSEFLQEAEKLKAEWPPFKAGIFGSNYDEFAAVAKDYTADVSKFGWF